MLYSSVRVDCVPCVTHVMIPPHPLSSRTSPLPTPLLHVPPVPFLRRRPYAASMSSGAFRACKREPRIEWMHPRIGHAISARGRRVSFETATVRHSNPQQWPGSKIRTSRNLGFKFQTSRNSKYGVQEFQNSAHGNFRFVEVVYTRFQFPKFNTIEYFEEKLKVLKI